MSAKWPRNIRSAANKRAWALHRRKATNAEIAAMADEMCHQLDEELRQAREAQQHVTAPTSQSRGLDPDGARPVRSLALRSRPLPVWRHPAEASRESVQREPAPVAAPPAAPHDPGAGWYEDASEEDREFDFWEAVRGR